MSTAHQRTRKHSYATALGRRIKAARRKAGLNQHDLSKATSIPYTSMSDIEGGRKMPRVDTIQRIAKAIGVSLDDLLPPSK